MGSRTAVDQAFSRLARDGHLIRIDRGAYVFPAQPGGRYTAPAVSKVVEALAAISGEIIVPDGMASAVSLGLASQTRGSSGYVTSGRSRILLLERDKVVLTHAPSWMLAMAGEPAGSAIRAMAWRGPGNMSTTFSKLRLALSGRDWSMLAACRSTLPSWMARGIGEEILRTCPTFFVPRQGASTTLGHRGLLESTSRHTGVS